MSGLPYIGFLFQIRAPPGTRKWCKVVIFAPDACGASSNVCRSSILPFPIQNFVCGLILLCCQSAVNSMTDCHPYASRYFYAQMFLPRLRFLPSRWSDVFPPTFSQFKLILLLQVRLDTSGYPQTVISR